MFIEVNARVYVLTRVGVYYKWLYASVRLRVSRLEQVFVYVEVFVYLKVWMHMGVCRSCVYVCKYAYARG